MYLDEATKTTVSGKSQRRVLIALVAICGLFVACLTLQMLRFGDVYTEVGKHYYLSPLLR